MAKRERAFKRVTKQGRPTSLNKTVQDKIVNAIRLGAYVETAAVFSGVSKVSFYAWLKKGNNYLRLQKLEEHVLKLGLTAGLKKAGTKLSEFDKLRHEFESGDGEKYLSFLNAIEKAMGETEVRDLQQLDKHIGKNWQAIAWRLERKFPKRWGRKALFKIEDEDTKESDSGFNEESLNTIIVHELDKIGDGRWEEE